MTPVEIRREATALYVESVFALARASADEVDDAAEMLRKATRLTDATDPAEPHYHDCPECGGTGDGARCGVRGGSPVYAPCRECGGECVLECCDGDDCGLVRA
jgi:hypothetical protein